MERKFRTEKDSMGEMQVPEDALYAAQTQRAVENFPISSLRFTRPMIFALGATKQACARVNKAKELLDPAMFEAISKAATEVREGTLDEHFVVDIFQTGSGTSSNMNTNEVIASRASQILGEKIHPNDHVNMSQSSNDVIPTAIHIAAAKEIKNELLPNLEILHASLVKKSKEFSGLVKTGRTHLMDATPVTLGQEFGGYAAQIKKGIRRVSLGLEALLELPIGGTAVGTGLNTPEGFAPEVVKEISEIVGISFREADDHFEAQAAKDALVETSGQLKTLAVSLIKIANDIRLMGSGPRCGLGEISLPSIQPGSSIMPGKINPVVCESTLMIASQVIGNDAAITTAGHIGSTFELNVAMPIIAHNTLESISIISSGAENLAKQCIDGIEANPERLEELAEANISTVTSLAPVIGYEKSAELAKEAWKSGRPLREVAKEAKVLPDAELDRLLDLDKMTRPGL